MSPSDKRDMGHSAFRRLLNIARSEQQDFNLLLQRYGMERFLYRLSISRHKERFVLKGANMFLVWKGRSFRVTRDADLLAFGALDVEGLTTIFSDLCQIDLEAEDGMVYIPATLNAAAVREDREYDGIRMTFEGQLHRARIPLHFDIGSGDAVTPGPETVVFPVLLDTPAPVLKGYPRYTMAAEKFEAMVRFGPANSRMKDFYDVCLLSRLFEFDGDTLCKAIAKTFERRTTVLPVSEPFAFTEAFFMDSRKRAQWKAFVEKTMPAEAPEHLEGAIQEIARFLMPPIRSLRDGTSSPVTWLPETGWQ